MIYNAELSALEGDLATEYAVSDDQLEYTFKLAEETWHDGEAFTANDVKFTIELAKNAARPAPVFAARLTAIASVETPDDRTVVLKLSQPNAALLSVLTQLMILPEHAWPAIPRQRSWPPAPGGRPSRSAPVRSSSRATSPTNMSSWPPTRTTGSAGPRSTA